MLSSTLWRALTTPVTYALVAVLVGTAIMQVKYVNRALQRFNSTQVIPIQFVMFTLSVIIGSAVLYRDFEKATPDMVGKFIGGCALTFFGVFLITSGRPSREDGDEEEQSDGEGEERISLTQHENSGQEGYKYNEYNSIRRRSALQDDDTGNDDSLSDSRRSSRVSFADQPRPRTPQTYLNSSYQPSGRLIPSILPAGIDGAEDTPLLNNPWKTSTDDLLRNSRHPGIQSVVSTPHLPSEAQTSSKDSLKPPPITRTTSQSNVHTHPNLQTSPAQPQGDRPDRPMTPARHSISRMMPGPLLSPLSGGLSAVVADSLLRGIEAPRSKSSRRPRLGLKRKKSGSQRLSNYSIDDEEDELGTSPSKSGTHTNGHDMSKSLGTDGTNAQWSRITRARSLSNTLGDLFRGKRQKVDTPDDEEAGPSGP